MLGSRSAYTRARILEAAEGLFDEKGYESTSLREITAKARVNLSSVHYHFGSKEGLIHAVHERMITALNRERVEMLSELECRRLGKPPQVEQIIGAYFKPVLRHAVQQTLIGKLLSNAGPNAGDTDKPLSVSGLLEPDALAYDRFRIALESALPSLPRPEILWRFQFMLTIASCALAQMGGLPLAAESGCPASADLEETSERVLGFLVGGLLAPATALNRR